MSYSPNMVICTLIIKIKNIYAHIHNITTILQHHHSKIQMSDTQLIYVFTCTERLMTQ